MILVGVIPLSQGKFTIVDADDFEKVNQYKWTYHKGRAGKAYAVRQEPRPGGRVFIRLHRYLKDLPPGSLNCELVVDHRNRDGLDNRDKENLEVVTRAENLRRIAARKVVEPFL